MLGRRRAHSGKTVTSFDYGNHHPILLYNHWIEMWLLYKCTITLESDSSFIVKRKENSLISATEISKYWTLYMFYGMVLSFAAAGS